MFLGRDIFELVAEQIIPASWAKPDKKSCTTKGVGGSRYETHIAIEIRARHPPQL